MDYLTWTLQILILTLGIYLFLRFLRTTQGNRIVRGLAFAVPLVAIVIWGTAYSLQLEELRHILKGVAGFAAILIAILFQDELRRGMAQFGENPLVRRFVPSTDTDVLDEICRAAVDMATKQETHGSFTRIRPYGALIVFERENSLQTYIHGGSRIESRVSHELLETIFRPKSPLHDGAVIVRKDRIAAASCMLPLSQDLTISKSTGTRHRAAIGLSEQTDAVVLVISEETGRLSIAAAGSLRTVAQGDLLDELRTSLGGNKEATTESMWQRFARFLREDLIWLAMSIVLATMMLLISHQDISDTREFSVRLVDSKESGSIGPQIITINLPDDDWRLKEPNKNRSFSVIATGSRAQLDQIGATLSGNFELDKIRDTETSIEINRISWSKTPPLGMSLHWAEGDTPQIVLERFTKLSIDLLPSMVSVDSSNLDPHYVLAPEGISFSSGTVVLIGPESAVQALEEGLIDAHLEGVHLGPEDKSDRTFPLSLPNQLTGRDFSLGPNQTIQITVPIRPATTEYSIDREVNLVAFGTTDRARLADWSLPANAREAKFTIHTSGLLPTTTGTEVYEETRRAIMRYVKENLQAYVDIADLPADGGARALDIRFFLRNDDWQTALAVDASRERAALKITSNNDPIYLTPKALPPGE